MSAKTIFIFGLGYSTQVFAHKMHKQGHKIIATTRNTEKANAFTTKGFNMLLYDSHQPSQIFCYESLQAALWQADGIISSIAPQMTHPNHKRFDADPILQDFAKLFITHPQKPWLGLLSSTGVYGDHNGAWVDETTPAQPSSERSKKRRGAELAWQELAAEAQLPLSIFRLSGIYGKGRGPLAQLINAQAQQIYKSGQFFNRVHVDDIAAALCLGFKQKAEGIFNITDDLPAPSHEVISFAAQCLGRPAPPLIPFEKAELTPKAHSFYNDNKRVSNRKSKHELGLQYRYPNYKIGISELAKDFLSKEA